ncbi:hypothetical protein BASA61_009763 [Batrachochytrium salamandrivorans]|nr:hypothetical protein BASA61_009763 [Batrachochytrium salamandrivorans]
MRLSTGVILSILSANVFAIEHLNDAHSGSLLARRAVVADADGPFLQKRNNNEDQKKQAKPKTFSNPNSPQAENAYTPVVSEDDPDSNPILALTLERVSQTPMPMAQIKVMRIRMKGKMPTQALILAKRGRAFSSFLENLPLKSLIV